MEWLQFWSRSYNFGLKCHECNGEQLETILNGLTTFLNIKLLAGLSVLGQVFDRRREVEAVRKEFGGSREHQLVRLADGHISDASDVSDLALSLLVVRRLRGHVDGCGRHRDGRPARDDVEVDGALCDVRGGLLHVSRQTERSAEPVHEVARLDDVDVGVVRLQDEFEDPADLLLADGAHGHDLLQRNGRVMKREKSRPMSAILVRKIRRDILILFSIKYQSSPNTTFSLDEFLS